MNHEDLLVLNRTEVATSLDRMDPVAVVAAALRDHQAGLTELPAEGYLAWSNSQGAYCRSLAMLGALTGDGDRRYGVKVINAATSNAGLGLERAGGVMLTFDPETARPRMLADAALISSTRTAAYTVLSVLHLGPVEPEALSVLGCGTQARRHLQLLRKHVPSLRTAYVHDLDPSRAADLAAWAVEGVDLDVRVQASAEECVAASGLLITATTSDDPYIPASWFSRPTFVAHMSLDDLLPEVFDTAEAIYVDDLSLVVENPRRILGALIEAGEVSADGGADGPRVLGTLADAIAGTVPLHRPITGHVVSNPFGMAILDVAVAAAVRAEAEQAGLGATLDLTR